MMGGPFPCGLASSGRRLFSDVSLKTVGRAMRDLEIHSDGTPNPGVVGGNLHSSGPVIDSINPSTLRPIGSVSCATADDARALIRGAMETRHQWASTPAPMRGQFVAELRGEIIKKKEALAAIISAEVGKIYQEALGEVQEIIDICDYAVGLSRMLPGSIFPSERQGHVLLETWRPAGVTGIITAFNFPAAVFGWNAALAWICGNPVVWKPSLTTSLTAVALTNIVQKVLKQRSLPTSLCSLAVGDGGTVGSTFADSDEIALISFTGSTKVGRVVGTQVQKRFGRSILELGGNNAIIVMGDADLELALRSVLFAAVGTTGQRCTTARRLFVHSSIFDVFARRLSAAYAAIRLGDPFQEDVHCGPVHTFIAKERYLQIITKEIEEQGGRVMACAKEQNLPSEGHFIRPAVVQFASPHVPLMQEEAFVPILYAVPFDTFEEAVAWSNEVPQALSSSIFTRDIQTAMRWTTDPSVKWGSECGIVNVNAPTNGAEIGGAFGGNKATGWGRESGGSAWQQYMTRHTCTINYSTALPLAQGIRFKTD